MALCVLTPAGTRGGKKKKKKTALERQGGKILAWELCLDETFVFMVLLPSGQVT